MFVVNHEARAEPVAVAREVVGRPADAARPATFPVGANRRLRDMGFEGLDAELLRDWLGLPVTDTTSLDELLDLFKLEAPLAVQSSTLPGFFPTNKFSAVPGLIRAARLASSEADGVGTLPDARKRLVTVPN